MKPRSSTVICWVLEDHTGVVTADQGEGEALIVFRDPKEVLRFQERTATEGLKSVGMSREELRELLAKYGLGWVAVSEPRAGESMVDLFTAECFIGMLEEGLEE